MSSSDLDSLLDSDTETDREDVTDCIVLKCTKLVRCLIASLCCAAVVGSCLYWVFGGFHEATCTLTSGSTCVMHPFTKAFDTAYGATLDAEATAPICGSSKWLNCMLDSMHTCGDSCCCDPGYIYHSSSCTCNLKKFVRKNFKKEEIARNMLYANCDGVTAKGLLLPNASSFGGLWWMDGNQAPEIVASFGNAQWDTNCKKSALSTYTDKERSSNTVQDQHGNSVKCQGRLILPVWEDRIWSMPDTSIGRAYADVVTNADVTMEFVCGGPTPENLQICKIGASTGPGNVALYNRIVNDAIGVADSAFNMLAQFTMVKVNDDYWIRYPLSDGSSSYFLKRIVTCSGEQGPYWPLYMSGATGIPPRQKDVFGYGGDNRTHVAEVPDPLFVRWSVEEVPMGSGPTCVTDVGHTCGVTGCSSKSNASCVDGRCVCAADSCAEQGSCV